MNLNLKFILMLFLLIVSSKVFAENEKCEYCIPNGSNITCEEIKEALNLINNKIRAEVKVQPLSWDCSLAEGSQKWAEKLTDLGYLEHSKDRNYGENLYMFYSSYGAIPPLKNAILSWYSEKKDFVYGEKYWCKTGKICGHYTQLVWSDTEKIGCGKAKKDNKVFIVCRFYPAGNWIGKQPYKK
ncbi:MAG: hypothetical protein DSY59_02825 [Persephonella sp.]|nr:MAG: hypothetical protein DSY60_02100 [Persephonella sp.]RUM60569.1 MAG: hypothetical protein DSY59_02825 [Persephonella sp.]